MRKRKKDEKFGRIVRTFANRAYAQNKKKKTLEELKFFHFVRKNVYAQK